MAIISGSANVTLREVDLSTRIPSFPGVYGAITIPAKKGLVNTPTLVTGDSQFLKRYTPNEKIDIGMDNSHFSALNFLQQSNKLWVNRVASNALYAILLYTSGQSELPTLDMSDLIGVNTASDTIGITASYNKYINTGDVVSFTTDGTLPSPLQIDTDYYAIKKDNGTIQVANTYEEATTLKKAITVDYVTNEFTVGTPLNFTVAIATNDDRINVNGHGLSDGDKIRLTPTPLAPAPFTVVFLTDNEVLNFASAHGLIDGQVITLSTSNTLPTGLLTSTTYYVTVIDNLSIKLSLTSGGSFETFSSNGTGTHQVDAGVLPAPLAPKSFTVAYLTNANNLVFGSAHGLVDGQQIRLSTAGVLPVTTPALDVTSFYYVNVVDSLTITLSITEGGSPLTFTGNGTAPNYVNPEIHYATVINANAVSIEPVVGSGAITFTSNGFGTHILTKPHGLSNLLPVQISTVGITQAFVTNSSVSNKVFTSVGHGLTDGTVIMVNNDKVASDLPASLDLLPNTRLYVVNATTNTFELSSTLGSLTQVTFTDNGTGTHYFNTGILPEPLTFNTTYYTRDVGFDTFKLSTTSGGSALNITDEGSGTILLESGFIDITDTGVDASYLNRQVFSANVKNTTFTTNYTSNNRLTLDSNVVTMLDTGTAVRFTSQGTLPNPLQDNSIYYVIKYPLIAPETQVQSYHTTSTTIKLAISYQDAVDYSPTNDTSITLTSNGSGTHSIHYNRGISENVNGYDLGNIVDNFVINQDSLKETVIVPQKFGERLSTGDKVTFSTNVGGKLPLPLIPNTTYYVVKQSDTEFKIATTLANATALTPIVLDLTDNISFTITSNVNAETDVITLPSQFTAFGSLMTTGTPVNVSLITTSTGTNYNVLTSSDRLPRPLKPNTTYYWIRIDDNNFKLALNPTNAVLGIAVDLTDNGSGDEMLISLEGTNKITYTPSISDPTSFGMGSDDVLLFYSANEGAWGNDIYVRLEDYRHKEADAFKVLVFKKTNLNIPVETFICSRKTKVDGSGRNIYIVDVLESSSYIRCFDNTLIDDTVFPLMSVATSTSPNSRSLSGGHDGDTVTEGKMILGASAFSNGEQYPVTVLMDGGWSFPSYQRQLDAIAQARQDCVAILSTPYDREANSDYLNSIVDYRKLDLNLNSSYSALYTPSPLVYDKFNDRKVYVSPDGFVSALISATAANYEMWYPVAGFKRGILNVLDLRRKFTKGEMDFLYDNGINPIRFAVGQGIVVWGQKTLLNRPSALDRLNVRLLLITIEPAIKTALADFLFDLNDVGTRGLAQAIVESYLRGIQARRGITDFKVICDTSNNTDDDIDNHLMNIWIFIKPVNSLEYVSGIMAITATTLSFAVAEGLL